MSQQTREEDREREVTSLPSPTAVTLAEEPRRRRREKEKETQREARGMDFWQKARSVAAEAAKRSQDLTVGTSKLSDIMSETAKLSKEIAAEASRRAGQIRTEAIKGADRIKSSLADGRAAEPTVEEQQAEKEKELEAFGVTEELRDFVKEISITTFHDFPLPDDLEMSNVPTVSNVTQDLTEWQAKHANLVLSTVKEISKLRYELCPRIMRERKFWRIYFILVNSHVAPYEKKYMEEAKRKSEEPAKGDKEEETEKITLDSKSEEKKSKQQIITSPSPSAEQDLDVFLLGGDSDEGPGVSDADFNDDLDKMVDSSDDEKEKL